MIQALLQAAGGTTPLLPWTARLCLLHASLVGGNAGSRRWRSLSTVADSACSLALQDVATKGGSSGTTGNGKGPARLPPAKGASAREADMDGPFNTAFMAQVCEELVKIGATRVELSSPGNGFLHDFSGLSPSVGRGGSYPSRSADPLPGVHASGSFRLKLQALRDALLSTCGGEGNAEEPPMPMRMGMVGDVEPEDLEVHPEAVRRALERGRCGEAFIVAVKVSSNYMFLLGSICCPAESAVSVITWLADVWLVPRNRLVLRNRTAILLSWRCLLGHAFFC